MILYVHIKSNSKYDSVTVKAKHQLEIRISAVPVDGKANKYLANYLAKIFKVSKSSIVIIKGLNNPYKTIEIIADDEYVKHILSTLNKT